MTAAYAIVQETEPLVELLPQLTHRLDDVAKLLRREGGMAQEVKELQRRQESVETLLQSNRGLVEEVGARLGCDVVERADAERDSGNEGAPRLSVVAIVCQLFVHHTHVSVSGTSVVCPLSSHYSAGARNPNRSFADSLRWERSALWSFDCANNR